MRELDETEIRRKDDLLETSILSIIDNGLSTIGEGPVINFDSTNELNKTLTVPTCVPKLQFRRKLARKATTRITSWGHSFNNFVGFTKDEAPKDLQNVRSTISRRHDPLSRRKKFVMWFELIGLALGFLLFIVGLVIVNSETVRSLEDSNSTWTDFNLEFKLGKAKFEFTTVINFTWVCGVIVLLANMIGLFCTYGGVYSGMIFYSIFIIFVLLVITIGGSYVDRYEDHIRRDVRNNFKNLWVIGSIDNLFNTKGIERSFGCCGWNNAFDYCSGPEMSSIILNELNRNALENLGLDENSFERSTKPSFRNKEVRHNKPRIETNAQPIVMSPMDNDDYYNYYSYDSYDASYDECDQAYDDCDSSFRRKRSVQDRATNQRTCAADGNEHCVCQVLKEERLVPPYFTEVCKIQDDEPILVENVCPRYSRNGQRICPLNGCDDLIQGYFETYLMIPLIIIAVLMAIAFIFGLIFIVQITHNFRKDGLVGDKLKIRRTCERIYVNIRQKVYYLTMEHCSRLKHKDNKLNISTEDFLNMEYTNHAFVQTLENSPFRPRKSYS